MSYPPHPMGFTVPSYLNPSGYPPHGQLPSVGSPYYQYSHPSASLISQAPILGHNRYPQPHITPQGMPPPRAGHQQPVRMPSATQYPPQLVHSNVYPSQITHPNTQLNTMYAAQGNELLGKAINPGYQQPNHPYQVVLPLAHQYGYQQSFQHQLKMGHLAHSAEGSMSSCRGNKKALSIGINYFGQTGQLYGCINDVNNIKNLIKTRDFSEDADHMRILTDDNRKGPLRPTRRNIIEGMHWLISGARPNDSLFLHYSGHGSQKADSDGDEVDGYDETIVPVDSQSAGHIVDDEMNAILVRQLPRGARLTAIFDSCHSATVLDLPFVYDCYGNINLQKASRKNLIESGIETITEFQTLNPLKAIKSGRKTLKSLKALGNEGKAQEITKQTRSSQGDVVMFAGCKDHQTSADTKVKGYGSTGAASYAFINAINKGRNLTFIQLLAAMRETLRGKFSQVVQMSTGFATDMNKPFFF